MRAILDPSTRPRVFLPRGETPKGLGEAFETLPVADIRQYRPRKLPRSLLSRSSSDAALPLHSHRADRPVRPPSRQPRHLKPLEHAETSKRDAHMWKASIREWMRVHDVRSATRSWDLPNQDEKVLLEWFDAIDVDRNGDVDADEIKALLAANKIGCSPKRLLEIFSTAGKGVADGLSLHDFIKCMHTGGAAALFLPGYHPTSGFGGGGFGSGGGNARGSTRGSTRGGGAGRSADDGGDEQQQQQQYEEQAASLFGPDEGGPRTSLAEVRSDGDLAVLTYRRQRVLKDLQDPKKRSNFVTREKFLEKYIPGALPAYKERWATRTMEAPQEPAELTLEERGSAIEGNYFTKRLEEAREEQRREEELAASKRAQATNTAPIVLHDTLREERIARQQRARSKLRTVNALAPAPSMGPAASAGAIERAMAASVSMPAL